MEECVINVIFGTSINMHKDIRLIPVYTTEKGARLSISYKIFNEVCFTVV